MWWGLIAFGTGLSMTAAAAAQRPWTPVVVIDGDPVMRGLPRDAIPAIDRPVFVSAAAATFMRSDEYVIGVTDGTTAKSYSLWHLNGHEIVNDTLGGRPIAVTWCPLCFTGIVYSRTVGTRVLSFGVTGMLWREDLVMYDRETDSWWAQASGRAIRGELAGARLDLVPATMTTWQEWQREHPATLVLRKSVGSRSSFGDVYAGYHRSGDLGVTGRLRRHGSVDPKTRVLGFHAGDEAFAVPLAALRETPVLPQATREGPVVVVASRGRTGARVFRAGDHVLETAGGGRPRDTATGSTWDGWTGRAVDGPLRAAALEEIPSHQAYWFAWRAFFPDTRWVVEP